VRVQLAVAMKNGDPIALPGPSHRMCVASGGYSANCSWRKAARAVKALAALPYPGPSSRRVSPTRRRRPRD
jgi:hypothetical protein